MSKWKGFRESLQGSGTITYFNNGQAARLSSNSSTNNRATLYYEAPAYPGVTYEFTYNARMIDGSGSTAPWGAIGYPDSANDVVDRVEYTDQWREYRMTFTTPFNADPDAAKERVVLALGVFSSQIGILEVTRPIIKISGSTNPMDTGFVREELYVGNGIFGAAIPLGGRLWTDYDQIWIYASQNSTGAWDRGSSMMIDVPSFIAANPSGTYVQLIANTGSSTALSHKADITLSSNGSMSVNSTQIGTTSYYVRAVIGYQFPWRQMDNKA